LNVFIILENYFHNSHELTSNKMVFGYSDPVPCGGGRYAIVYDIGPFSGAMKYDIEFDFNYITREVNRRIKDGEWKCEDFLCYEEKVLDKIRIIGSVSSFNSWTNEICIFLKMKVTVDNPSFNIPNRYIGDNVTKRVTFKYQPPAPWKTQRLFWIAKFKNIEKRCAISRLPVEIIKCIIKLL
jgi:hypothetical protein